MASSIPSLAKPTAYVLVLLPKAIKNAESRQVSTHTPADFFCRYLHHAVSSPELSLWVAEVVLVMSNNLVI